jgi:hypothetical protein
MATESGYLDINLDDSKATDTQKLVLSCVPLAISIANSHFRSCPYYSTEDRHGEALWALCYAAERYRPETGFSFTTYASKVVWDKLKRGRCKYATFPQDAYENLWEHRNMSANSVDHVDLRDTVELVLMLLDPQERAIADAIMDGMQTCEMVKSVPRRDGQSGDIGIESVRRIRSRMALELLNVIGPHHAD